jgi:hypothetical protein
MINPDVLTEFEIPADKPKVFRFIILLVTIIICSYIRIIYPTLKYFYIEEKDFWQWRTYFYFLIFLYPIVGLQGYMLSKKYGWFVLSHYALTSTIIILMAGISSLFDGHTSFLKSVLILAFSFINTICILLLLRRRILQLFNITKDNILLFILLTVIFTIVHITILILG